MQVYKITGPTSKDIYLRNFQDIAPSLRITYSTCAYVKITARPQATGGPMFLVTGRRTDGTADFEETFQVTRIAVYDSPTHL